MTERSAKYKILKKQLSLAGSEALEDFLGYGISDDEDKNVTDNRLDEAEAQMPDEEFERFYAKYVTNGSPAVGTAKVTYSDDLVLFTSVVSAAAVLEHREEITIPDDESLTQACLDILQHYTMANKEALASEKDVELPEFSLFAEKELNNRFGPRTQKVCPKCGSEVKGFKFCPECGEKL